MSTYTGPAKIECPLRCDVPEGVTLTEVPPARHAWSDILRCPNGDGCERTFLVEQSQVKT